MDVKQYHLSITNITKKYNKETKEVYIIFIANDTLVLAVTTINNRRNKPNNYF